MGGGGGGGGSLGGKQSGSYRNVRERWGMRGGKRDGELMNAINARCNWQGNVRGSPGSEYTRHIGVSSPKKSKQKKQNKMKRNRDAYSREHGYPYRIQGERNREPTGHPHGAAYRGT